MSLVGQTLAARYRILEELGRGAMGLVYKAYDERMARHAVVKVLGSAWAKNEKLRDRLRTEALIQGNIIHPNIVRAIDMVDEGETLAIIMDFVPGENLGERMKRGPLGLDELWRLLEPVLDAVQEAHRKGVVHRDLKPDNVLLEATDGDFPIPKVTDFGIAKVLAPGAGGGTSFGTVMGTPAYMAPEQHRGQLDIDGRADVYALGVVLYEALTGQLPYGDGEEVTRRMTQEVPAPPSQLRPELPAILDQVVLAAMNLDRDARLESPDALRIALATALGVQTTSIRRGTLPPGTGNTEVSLGNAAISGAAVSGAAAAGVAPAQAIDGVPGVAALGPRTSQPGTGAGAVTPEIPTVALTGIATPTGLGLGAEAIDPARADAIVAAAPPKRPVDMWMLGGAIVALATLAALAGRLSGGRDAPVDHLDSPKCETSRDCKAGGRCLDGRCGDIPARPTAAGAAYGPPGTRSSFPDLVKTAEDHRTEMCACQNARCALGVMRKIEAFDRENDAAKVALSANANVRIESARQAARECFAKATRTAPAVVRRTPPRPRGSHVVVNTYMDEKEPWLCLRAGPRGKARLVAEMHDGTEVEFLNDVGGHKNRWWLVKVMSGSDAGKVGWAHSRWLSRLP